LNLDREEPPLLIDLDTFSSALSAGEFDVCLRLLRNPGGTHPTSAILNCRLAEALFHNARRDDALECGRRAFVSAPEDSDAAHFCAWLFSNCGCYQEAATAYERLLALSPDWAEGHRHLSGSLAAAGDLDGAVAHALRAAELLPEDNGTAIHAAELLLRGGDLEAAAALVRAAAAREPSDDRVLRILSAIPMTKRPRRRYCIC
jgi:tetratricopeptide (TPR) repeat protein